MGIKDIQEADEIHDSIYSDEEIFIALNFFAGKMPLSDFKKFLKDSNIDGKELTLFLEENNYIQRHNNLH